MTGSGTAADPYIISTVTDLQNIDDDLTAYYELGGNIDASATSTWNSNQGFAPIGKTAATAFSGQLDGKGYTVSDLFIDRTGVNGLFYIVSGTVQNLGLVDINMTSTGSIGGMCQENQGTIPRCYVTGVMAGGSHMGGFVQWNSTGTITNSFSRVSITGDGGNNIAGFVQFNGSAGTCDDCYATGALANGGGGAKEAGFCQLNDGGSIPNCFWDTETTGQASSDGGTGKTTAQMKTESTFTDAGWDFLTIWFIDGVSNNGYPALGLGAAVYPTVSTSRVSSVRHIFRPGFFRMQVALGELGFDVDVAEATVRKTLDTAEEIADTPSEPVVGQPPPTTILPSDVTAPPPGELTEYAKRIQETPAARALSARISGLRQGLEAVVTPYAIDVLIKKEREAKLVIEVQRITRAAKATGITDYARKVLEKRAEELRQQLETAYRSR